MDGRVWEAHARRARAGPLGGVRHRAQPPRLAAARVRASMAGAAGHDRPRLLRAADPAGVRAGRVRLRRDLGRRSFAAARATWRRCITASTSTELAVPTAPAATTSSCSAASTRTKARQTRSRSRGGPAAGWSSAASCRTSAYFAEHGRAARRRRPRALPRLGRAAERAAVLGGAAALLHPIHFDEPFGLSVVEAMACGHTGRRVPPRIDAGDHRRRCDGVRGARCRRAPSRRSTERRASIGARSARWPHAGSGSTGWSTSTSASTSGSSPGDGPQRV